MPGERRIRIRGAQREQIDADLMAQIVVLLGRQLAREASGETVTALPGKVDDLDALEAREEQRQRHRHGNDIAGEAVA